MLTDCNECDARSFCRRSMGLTVLGLGVVAGLNFLVNPYAQYPSHILPPMVQTSRAEKVELFHACRNLPEGLVLGSSRTLKMEPDYLAAKTGVSFFNAGVNYGRVEDALAWLRYYETVAGHAPEIIVFGIDVASFSEGPIDSRLLNQRELIREVPDAVRWKDRTQVLRDLVSWQQMKYSCQSLVKAFRTSHGASVAQQEKDEFFRPDGLLVYRTRERQFAEGTYDITPALRYNEREYRAIFSKFSGIDPLRRDLMRTFAAHCQRKSIRLVAYLTPMHPRLLSYLVTSTPYAERKSEVWEFLSELSHEYTFDLVDMSRVDDFGGSPDLFVDGIHPLEANTRLIVDKLMASPGVRSRYVVQ